VTALTDFIKDLQSNNVYRKASGEHLTVVTDMLRLYRTIGDRCDRRIIANGFFKVAMALRGEIFGAHTAEPQPMTDFFSQVMQDNSGAACPVFRGVMSSFGLNVASCR
jgi:hypothetical protein